MTETSAWHIQLFSLAVNAPVRWRLLSGNNRDMGRSLDEFDDVESCRVALKQLQVDAADLVARVRRLTPSSWQWEITLDEQPIASSGHPFDRLIRCEQGMTQFVTHFATAPIGATLMVSESRRWRAAC
jgi:hypothetical protein